ncbi:isochorismatase family protein [Paludifilum halophilum]|uniref:Isochorismatase-like domain-containing protein n=1 Tax=Paludifilum halophilum TaxID=1642702 RepID=A0A235B5Y4_9BACL|nr:isochorismatase family protein [Paludifilum halophilum]OYD07700.1 hypothetical protein CHM34_09495 [Paludifilum halophilum]
MKDRLAFWEYIDHVVSDLRTVSLPEVIEEAGGVDRVHLVLVDILRGFCAEGPLASARVNEVVQPVRGLADQLLEHGMPDQNLIFLQDSHQEKDPEFNAFPPHCVKGTDEAKVMEPLRPLLERQGVQLFLKNATNGMFGSRNDGQRFHEQVEERLQQGKAAFIVVGDCTDLCIYQNAMGIRLLANQLQADTRVIVSRRHTRTYHMSVEDAREMGAMAHDGDLMDELFLYHMKLNGIDVVQDIALHDREAL